SDDTPGQTFTLTTGVDTLVGGAGNDTFRAFIDGTNDTLNPLDKIDGAGGTNTLYIDVDAAGSIPHSATVANIQIIELEHTDAVLAATLDSDDFGGAQEIWQINQFAGAIEVGADVLVGFRGDDTAVNDTITVKDGVEEVAVSVDGVLDASAIDFAEITPADLG